MRRYLVAYLYVMVAANCAAADRKPVGEFEMRDNERATPLSKRAAQLPPQSKSAAEVIRWMGRAPDFTVTKKLPDPQKLYAIERGESFILFWLNGPCSPIEISDAGGKVAVASDGTAMCLTDGQSFPDSRLPEQGNPIWCRNSPSRPYCGSAAKTR
jgi:hypothetical protein